jgi:hypothetical protein
MTRLSTLGGFPSDAIDRAKAELAETLEFSEQQEVLPRNRDGRVSAGGFIEQHFNFAETKSEKEEMKKLRAELAAIKKQMENAYDQSTMERAAAIKKELTNYARQEMVNLQAAKAGASITGDLPVNMGREAEVAEIEAPEAKVGKVQTPSKARKKAGKKINPAYDTSTVAGYKDYQRIMERNDKTQGLEPAYEEDTENFRMRPKTKKDFERKPRLLEG